MTNRSMWSAMKRRTLSRSYLWRIHRKCCNSIDRAAKQRLFRLCSQNYFNNFFLAHLDCRKRLTASQALQHPWINVSLIDDLIIEKNVQQLMILISLFIFSPANANQCTCLTRPNYESLLSEEDGIKRFWRSEHWEEWEQICSIFNLPIDWKSSESPCRLLLHR